MCLISLTRHSARELEHAGYHGVAPGQERCQSDWHGLSESIPQPPPPEPVQRRRPAWLPSDDLIPGLVPAEVVIVRTEQVAVAIGGIHAYPNGF